MTSLADLAFSDLCIDPVISRSWIKATPDSLKAEPLPGACHDEAGHLLVALEAQFRQVGKPNFRFVWRENPIRVQRMQLYDGTAVFICRQFRKLAGGLTGLGVPRPVAAELLSPRLREGMVVFLGKAGSGKTTVAGTLIVERLATLGGICWTIENPIEMTLEGRHGQGICYQTEASSDERMAALIAEVYRATPNMILVGEARDGHTVREALVASLSGHLVILTLHAGDIITGISRLASLHGGGNAFRVLADALRVLVHLNLHHPPPLRPLQTAQRVLSVEPLLVNAESVQAVIRDGSLHMLRNEIERQRRVFMSHGQEQR
ncbi:ATPase, T2SS/T4P/T4SS family [Propionivibrio sp.]|uniref:ATPase, T2SS/T4P/T4SS family n=1 Tax=Propionivibrio sp. TaxID=2212460 RepID=UPI0039E2B802